MTSKQIGFDKNQKAAGGVDCSCFDDPIQVEIVADTSTHDPVVETDVEYTCEKHKIIMHQTTTVDGVVQGTVDIDTGKECDTDDGTPVEPKDFEVVTTQECIDGSIHNVTTLIDQDGTETALHDNDLKLSCGKCSDFNSLTLHVANRASYTRCSGLGVDPDVLGTDFDPELRCYDYNTEIHDIGLGENSIGHLRVKYCYSLDKPAVIKAVDPANGEQEFLISLDGATPIKVKEFTLPAGCHCVEAETLYAKDEIRRVGFTYNDDKPFPLGRAWANPDAAYKCILAKVCKPSGNIFDHATGTQIKPETIVPCDCLQAWKDNQVSASSDDVAKHCIQLYGWDGMLNEQYIKEGSDQGNLMDFNVKIDGVDHLMEIDYFATSDHVNKSTWYDMVVDYVNSQPGLTMTLVHDASVDADGDNHDAPLWKLEYEGNTPKEVVFWKSGGESIMTINFTGTGDVNTSANWDYADGTSNPYIGC